MAVVKGQSGGVRDVIGNLSAPWIVLPFIAGTRVRRPWHGALVGVIATMAALLGFYVAEAAILDLGVHPWYEDLRLTAGSINVYEKCGVFTGAAYGAFGALWAARQRSLAAFAVVLAFLAEPFIVYLLQRSGIWGGGILLDYPGVWLCEVAIGVGLATAFTVRYRRS